MQQQPHAHYTRNNTSSAPSDLIAQKDRLIAWQAAEIRMLRAQKEDLERQVRLLQEEPERADADVRAQAAQAEETARINRDVLHPATDPRLPAGHPRVRAALVKRGCTREGPTVIYREALAEDTGYSLPTITHHLQDMEQTLQIRVERPRVRKEVLLRDKKGQPVRDKEGQPIKVPKRVPEMRITLLDGPPRDWTKEDVQARCQAARRDQERHEQTRKQQRAILAAARAIVGPCPHCGADPKHLALHRLELVCHQCTATTPVPPAALPRSGDSSPHRPSERDTPRVVPHVVPRWDSQHPCTPRDGVGNPNLMAAPEEPAWLAELFGE